MPRKKSQPKKAKSAKKPNKMENLSQAHGKDESQDQYQPTTLDQVWGDTGLWKYNTMSEASYKEELDQMSKSDLFTHASKHGIIPTDNRDLLVTKLMREFRKYVSAYRVPRPNTDEIKNFADLPPEVKKILKEGS